MKIDFLQIGFQRCGTSFLEASVYPCNPHLEHVHAPAYRELGKLLLRDFILADGLEYDRQSFERKFIDICETIFTNKQSVVRGIMFRSFTFSDERRFDRKNVIDRINESFPEVKIIMCIRSQQTWIPSQYWTYLRNGGVLNVHDFAESILNNEAWCVPYMCAHYIDWFPLVSYLYKVFGSERVLICLYEELKKSPQDIANRIFDFLEVPRVQIDESRVNPSPSKEIMPLRRFLNHLVHFGNGTSAYNYYFNLDPGYVERSTISKLYNTFIYKIYSSYTEKLCREVDNAFGVRSRLKLFKGRLKLEERHLKMIEQRYSSHNRKLSELLKVDLSSYGYP